MSTPITSSLGGHLFSAPGSMLFIAACLGSQVAFCGTGAAFIAIGASFLIRAKRGWGRQHYTSRHLL